jgi:hypothetical protein
MAEADIHLRPLHTSIFDIYKGFALLVCCLKGMWVHPYTVTPAKLAPLFVQISHQRLPFTTNYTTLGRYVGISILTPLTLTNHNGERKHNAATLGYTLQTL